MEHAGSCLCGDVRYRITGELGTAVYCHCRQCRKAQGTAFATNAPVAAAGFELVSGADRITEFESSSGKKRAFCSRCGSPVYSRRDDDPETLRVRLGTLDTPLTRAPSAHIFAASRAEWFVIRDDLPRFDGRPPSDD